MIDTLPIAQALSCGRSGCPCAYATRKGMGLVHCPAHGDGKASLSLTAKPDRLLVHCHAGCSQDDVIAALRERNLWPNRTGNGAPVAAAKSAPARQTTPGPRREYRWEIKNVAGELVAVHRRIDPEKRIWWTLPNGTMGLGGLPTSELPLYLSEQLDTDVIRVVLVEGEKAADALAAAVGQVVATVCGAAVTPCDAVLAPLAGHAVYLWPDADVQGRAHMEAIRERLRALGGSVLMIDWDSAPEHGDAADFLAHGGALEDLFRGAACEHRPAGEAEASWELYRRDPDLYVCSCCCGPVERRDWDSRALCSRCQPPSAESERIAHTAERVAEAFA